MSPRGIRGSAEYLEPPSRPTLLEKVTAAAEHGGWNLILDDATQVPFRDLEYRRGRSERVYITIAYKKSNRSTGRLYVARDEHSTLTGVGVVIDRLRSSHCPFCPLDRT